MRAASGQLDLAAAGAELAENQAEEGGLAGAVAADQADFGAVGKATVA